MEMGNQGYLLLKREVTELLTRVKSLSDERLASIGKGLQRIGLTPNRLSMMGLIFILIAAWFLFNEEILPGLVFIGLGGIADVLDGMVARTTNQRTVRGGFLDSMIDRYADTLIIGAMLLGGWLETLKVGSWEWDPISSISGDFWALGALSGALLTSYSRAAAERLGVKQEGIGLIERPERMVILIIGLLIQQITPVLVVLTVLGHFTVLQRAHHFWTYAESTTDGGR